MDGPEVQHLIQALLDANIMVDPTLVTSESLYFGHDERTRILAGLDADKMPKAAADWLWSEGWEQNHRYLNDNNHSQMVSLRPLFKLEKDLALKLFKRGVIIGAGTDVGMPWITPGASLHKELELLVQAGFSNEEAISVATKNGGKFIYNSTNVGTIERGKLADMLVLSKNPLTNIENTRSIKFVVQSGDIYIPQELMYKANLTASQLEFPTTGH